MSRTGTSRSWIPHPRQGLLWLVAFAAPFLPLVIIWVFQLWAPVATVQEAFGTYYEHHALMQEDFHFVPTGHFALLILARPARVLVDVLIPGCSEFDRQHVFSLLFLLLHGLGLMLVFAWALRSRLPAAAKALLLFVPFASNFIEPLTILGCYINYHKLLEVLFLILACLVMRWFNGDLVVNRRLAFSVGVFAAIAIGTKFSMAFVMMPFALVVCIPVGQGAPRIALSLATFAVGCLIALFSIYLVYLHFNVAYVARFISDTSQIYASGWCQQKTPFLLMELGRFFDVSSHYFGWHLLVSTWLCLTAGSTLCAFWQRDVRLILLHTARVFTALLLARMFASRIAAGTMIDITNYLAFDIAVQAFVLARSLNAPVLVRAGGVALCACYLISAAVSGPGETLNRLAFRSALAREIDSVLGSRPDLPVVYYMENRSQPLLFPSASINSWFGAPLGSAGAGFLTSRYPGVHFAEPKGGLLPFPHVAVVPEYLDALTATPETKAEWPEMWPPVDVFGQYPEFAAQLRGPRLRVFQFNEVQPPGRFLYLTTYRTKVTVAILPDPR